MRLRAILGLITLLPLGVAVGTVRSEETPKAEWTILVFLNGDNDLEQFGIKDFLEVAKLGSSDKINVVVQFDRAPGYDSSYGDWTQTLRFRVTKGMEPTVKNALEDLGEQNMGDGKVLAEFVRWGREKYPAKHYMLDVWDHGQGWRSERATTIARGSRDSEKQIKFRKSLLPRTTRAAESSHNATVVPSDMVLEGTVRYISLDESQGDKLYNREIQDELSRCLTGEKLDLIGFDACLMAMVETAFAMRGVARVMVASEELAPGDGWDYCRVLEKLIAAPSSDGKQLGSIIVQAYRDTYEGHDDETTLSAVDLSRLDDLAKAVSRLADACAERMQTDASAKPPKQTIQDARKLCKSYAPAKGLHGIDLGHYCEKLLDGGDSVRQEAEAVLRLLRQVIIANYAGSDRQGDYGSMGLAIYFPPARTQFEFDIDHEGYRRSTTIYPVQFVQDERWADFLYYYFERVP